MKPNFKYNPIPFITCDTVSKPLPTSMESCLLELGCHVDHEGFDLNEIEQLYHKYNGIALDHDPTWYKDGGGSTGANAIIIPWIDQVQPSGNLIIDHSHFVVRYPVMYEAADQIRQFSEQRPELLRILSAGFKCGLDLCIDILDQELGRVSPIVHIEWDFDNPAEMYTYATSVQSQLESMTDKDWQELVSAVQYYNSRARMFKINAFDQADTRAMMLFGERAYKLIPTL